MLDSGRLPGAMALAAAPTSPYMFGTPAFTAKSSIWLLSRMPVPGTTMPEPNQPFSVIVPATRLPSASSTEKWVVCWPCPPASTYPASRSLGVARSLRIEARRPAA